MPAVEKIEKRVLALPLAQRVFLAETLLGSLPPVTEEMTETEEMAEVERRETEIESGKVRSLSDAEFWRGVETDRNED